MRSARDRRARHPPALRGASRWRSTCARSSARCGLERPRSTAILRRTSDKRVNSRSAPRATTSRCSRGVEHSPISCRSQLKLCVLRRARVGASDDRHGDGTALAPESGKSSAVNNPRSAKLSPYMMGTAKTRSARIGCSARRKHCADGARATRQHRRDRDYIVEGARSTDGRPKGDSTSRRRQFRSTCGLSHAPEK